MLKYFSYKHDISNQCCFNVGPPSATLPNIKSIWVKRLVFAGIGLINIIIHKVKAVSFKL